MRRTCNCILIWARAWINLRASKHTRYLSMNSRCWLREVDAVAAHAAVPFFLIPESEGKESMAGVGAWESRQTALR